MKISSDVNLKGIREYEVMSPSPLTRILQENINVPLGCVAVDLGCGSGEIALALLDHGAKYVYAIDIDPMAVEIAVKHASNSGMESRLIGVVGSIENIYHIVHAQEKLVIASNPPQLPSLDIEEWSKQTHEQLAYNAGTNGRYYIDTIIKETSYLFARQKKDCALQFVTTSVIGIELTLKNLKKHGFEFHIVAEAEAEFRPVYYDVINKFPEGWYSVKSNVCYETIYVIHAWKK